ncbi:MAG: DUF6629 family protein [Parvularculaceae bacterium]
MCFSATASFTAAAGLAFAGVATLGLKPAPRLIPYALTPLLFAAHQMIEGFVWLSVNETGTAPPMLINAWVFIAKSFWPVWTPFMVLVLEGESRRRIGLITLLIVGAAISALLLYVQLSTPFHVSVVDGNLRYASDHPLSDGVIGLYVLATVAPMLISRHHYVALFGVAVLVGSATTELAYRHAGPSVWCFFAALASGLVFLHVREQSRAARV